MLVSVAIKRTKMFWMEIVSGEMRNFHKCLRIINSELWKVLILRCEFTSRNHLPATNVSSFLRGRYLWSALRLHYFNQFPLFVAAPPKPGRKSWDFMIPVTIGAKLLHFFVAYFSSLRDIRIESKIYVPFGSFNVRFYIANENIARRFKTSSISLTPSDSKITFCRYVSMRYRRMQSVACFLEFSFVLCLSCLHSLSMATETSETPVAHTNGVSMEKQKSRSVLACCIRNIFFGASSDDGNV